MGDLQPARLLLRRALVIAVLAAGAAAAVWWWAGRRPPDDVARAAEASPFRNVRAGVQYVGDEACARCHPTYADSFRQHPMGRSFFPISHDDSLERYDAAANNPFDALRFQFRVERGPEGVVHRTVQRDAQGMPVAETADKVAYVMGSGTRGRSYLVDRGGYLFQSPISWFTQKKGWDLSPKFELFYPPERVIEVSCVYCHANDADWVPHSRNHYREPVFRQYAIGCERCHGPGELHVALRERDQEPAGPGDDTIVNSRRLPTALREAVCQQCHLQGEKRVARWDRSPFEYRPGLPLHLFWSVFVRPPDAGDTHKAVGQVEQMYASRCFRGSDGKLGCISCHDPHVQPAAEVRVGYFRDRCLSCHETHPCALPEATRRKKSPADSCVDCHMPRLPSANIAHTAVTDHRILRQPDKAEPGGPTHAPLQPGSLPVVNFFANDLDPHDAHAERDLGVALVHLSDDMKPLREQLGRTALPLLEKAVKEDPADAVAWEALGFALAMQGKADAARDALDAALRSRPTRELTLLLAAQLAQKMNRDDDAIGYLKRAAAVNPWVWDYRFGLASLLARRKQWDEAREHAEAALRLDPFSDKGRSLFITCCLQTGHREQAEEEFAKLVALAPGRENELRSWYAGQRREAAGAGRR